MPILRAIAILGMRLPAWRAAFVVTLSVALVLSLVRVPCCDGAADDGVAIEWVAAANPADAANGPQPSPAHLPAGQCDHCLAHVAFQPFANLAESRVEFASVTVALPNDAAPLSIAGLPLFKPPRA